MWKTKAGQGEPTNHSRLVPGIRRHCKQGWLVPGGYARSPVFQDLHLLSLPLSIDQLHSSSPLIYIYREIACFLLCLFPLSSHHSLSQLFAYHSLFTINNKRFIASIHFRSEPERLQSITPISINQQQYIKQQS